MVFQNDATVVHWKLHLRSAPEKVYQMLSTDEGSARFWAESAIAGDGFIDFLFPDGLTWRGKILEEQPPHRFVVEYFSGSLTTFELSRDAAGETDLSLTDEDVPEKDIMDVTAGWVAVLLALKAAVDFSVDLRNHSPLRTWDNGYVDN